MSGDTKTVITRPRSWLAAGGLAAAIALVLAACGGGGGSGTSFGRRGPCPDKQPPVFDADADLTVEELTGLVAEAITCPGYAFHMRSAGDQEAGPYSSHVEIETWIDMVSNVGRVQHRSRFTSEEAVAEAEEAGFDPEWRSTGIVRGDGSYSSEEIETPARKGRPPTCYEPGREALGLVLPCLDRPLQFFEISIDPNATYQGDSAIAYVAEGESSGSDETYYTTTRTFFDAETLLPMGQVVEGTLDIGEIHPVQTDIEYEHEFVTLDSLPSDFFEPASIGYVEETAADIEAPLDDAEIAVYWLGSTFDGGGEYPALALDYAIARPREQTLSFNSLAEIVYRPADDEFGRRIVRLGLYTPEAWEFREQDPIGNPCIETTELELGGAQAFVTRKYHSGGRSATECPPHDRFAAAVHFQDVVVEIDAPATGNGRETFFSPYDSEEAIELLVRSLVLRE